MISLIFDIQLPRASNSPNILLDSFLRGWKGESIECFDPYQKIMQAWISCTKTLPYFARFPRSPFLETFED